MLLAGACSERETLPALPPDAVVLAFGDSITYGVGAGQGEDYPTLLGRTSGWTVINAGISGDTAKRARNRIESLLTRHDPALVIVELGGNDFLRKRQEQQVKEDLRAVLRSAREHGSVTALVAVPQLSVLRAGIGALADSPIYAELAAEENVLLIPEVLSDILSDSTLLADRIHPNARGYQAMASALLQHLREAGLLL